MKLKLFNDSSYCFKYYFNPVQSYISYISIPYNYLLLIFNCFKLILYYLSVVVCNLTYGIIVFSFIFLNNSITFNLFFFNNEEIPYTLKDILLIHS